MTASSTPSLSSEAQTVSLDYMLALLEFERTLLKSFVDFNA
jgi:hypothetical protein